MLLAFLVAKLGNLRLHSIHLFSSLAWQHLRASAKIKAPAPKSVAIQRNFQCRIWALQHCLELALEKQLMWIRIHCWPPKSLYKLTNSEGLRCHARILIFIRFRLHGASASTSAPCSVMSFFFRSSILRDWFSFKTWTGIAWNWVFF